MKRKISILLLLLFVPAVFSSSVLATDTASGFYNIGTKENVVITPYASDTRATSRAQDVDNDGNNDTLYVNSNRLEVSYTAATSEAYYGVILVEGTGLPTRDNTIFYIDQVTASGNTVNFNVYPILPKKTTKYTLYISSNADGFDLISIPLNYYVYGTVPYTLGDVNDDGEFNVKDALIVLKIGVGDYPDATSAVRAAADVNQDGEFNVKDALMILRRSVGDIDSFE